MNCEYFLTYMLYIFYYNCIKYSSCMLSYILNECYFINILRQFVNLKVETFNSGHRLLVVTDY